MSENLQEIFLREIRRLLLPLAVATENDFRGQLLFDLTGWNLEAGSDPAIDQRLVEFIDAYESLDDLIEEPPETLTDVLEVLDKVNQLVSAVRLVKAQPGNEGQGPEELGKDLISALVIGYLKLWHPAVYDVLAVLTVIRPPADISLNRIPDLITDPLKVLGAEYLKPQGLITAEDAKSVTDKLFPRLAALLVDSGVQAVYGVKPENGPDLGEVGNHLGPGMLTVFLQPDFEKESRYSVMFALSPRDLGNLGLVVIPFGEPLPYWNVYVDLTAAAEGFAIGPQGLKILGASDKTSVSIRPSVFKLPGVLIGSAKGSRLEIGQFHISGDVNLDPSNLEYGLLLDMGSSTLVISADDGDGFLQEILPAEGVRADFDLAIGWSNKKGLYFRGSAGLDAELPVNRSLFGVLTLNSVHLSIETDGSGIQSSVATSISAQLGPVKALVDGAGLKTNFSFPDVGGNLGLLDLSLGFKPPSGIGLAISAPGVHGGGFLHFDPQKEEYSGIVELLIGEKIAVKALGLLVTRLPGGSKGYSLLIIITAEGFQPIPLPMGFRLTGIGGLLAINRTFAEDALRAGLKNHALDSVLFPQDPIRNAPQILSNLNRVFPPATGHYLFGPMVQIEWGTPTLVTAQVAVVLEFGARLRLLVLAQIVAILPRPEQDLIRLQMDAVGVVDFDQGTAALDATLHDSRLLQKFVMTGDMALRLKLAAPPNFALAVGGLHPAFNPPPNFPKLERIAINLAAGDNPRIRCEAYFALTGSSIQFGARAELYAKAAGFSIQGEIGFDVLIQRDPFAFLAEFYAKVQLKRGSTNLFMVKVEGALAGPRPLHVKAKATFEILWWDVSIRVDRTLVAGEKPPLPAPIDVLPRLLDALGQPGSWTARLPASQRPMVTLAAGRRRQAKCSSIRWVS